MRLDGDRRTFLIAMGALASSAGLHKVANNLFDPERSEIGIFTRKDQTILVENPLERSARTHSHWNTQTDNSELLLHLLGYKVPISTESGFIRNGTELDSIGSIHGTVSGRYNYSSPYFYVINLIANRLVPPSNSPNNLGLTHIYINADYVKEATKIKDMI